MHCLGVITYFIKNIGEKTWRIVMIHQIRQSFFPSKVFYCTEAGFKKTSVHPINRNKILLSTDTSASKQSTKASKYISDVYSV